MKTRAITYALFLLALALLCVGFTTTTAKAQTADTCLQVTGDHRLQLPSGELADLRFDLLHMPAGYHAEVTVRVVRDGGDGWRRQWRTWARPTAAFISGGLAGGAHATREVLIIDYPKFQTRFPNANPQFWNPDISHANKWAGGNSANGEAFPGSSTAFAKFTDGYHALPFVEGFLVVGGTAIVFTGERRKWWRYGLDLAAMMAGYWTAANLGYDRFYGMKDRR